MTKAKDFLVLNALFALTLAAAIGGSLAGDKVAGGGGAFFGAALGAMLAALLWPAPRSNSGQRPWCMTLSLVALALALGIVRLLAR